MDIEGREGGKLSQPTPDATETRDGREKKNRGISKKNREVLPFVRKETSIKGEFAEARTLPLRRFRKGWKPASKDQAPQPESWYGLRPPHSLSHEVSRIIEGRLANIAATGPATVEHRLILVPAPLTSGAVLVHAELLLPQPRPGPSRGDAQKQACLRMPANPPERAQPPSQLALEAAFFEASPTPPSCRTLSKRNSDGIRNGLEKGLRPEGDSLNELVP